MLVTGGAGFIGSHIVEVLVMRGHRVRVLDNFSTGKMENLEGLGNGSLTPGSDFEVIYGDIRDYRDVEKAVSGVEGIFHEAALGSVPRSIEDPLTTQNVNADGTLNVFTAARNRGVPRVVYASSSSVYGDSETLPKREGSEGKPLSPYALTKKVNEEFGRLFWDLELVSQSGTSTGTVNGISRAGLEHDAYFVHPPYRNGTGYTFWKREVDVPEDGRLELFTGMGEKSPERSDGAVFRVEVGEASEVRKLLRLPQ